MNLLTLYKNTEEMLDVYQEIMNVANQNGYKGFAGFCGQSAILINDLLFDGKQDYVVSFNKSLNDKKHYIGHIACYIHLNSKEYLILDCDGYPKAVEDINHWGMLDTLDPDYKKLLKDYNIEPTEDNLEISVEYLVKKKFIQKNFDMNELEENKNILLTAIDKVFSPKKNMKRRI